MPNVGKHYAGVKGEEYYAWQHRTADFGARLNARKFAKHIRPGDTVVDFGCGGGFLLEQLPGAAKIGIEPNPAAREAGRQRGVDIVANPSEVGSESADIVISNHALEHTLAPIDELRELIRILKSSGRLILWLPLDDWRRQRRADPDDVNHHLYTWTPQLIHNLLVEAGFDVQETRVVTHAWPPKVMLLSRLPEGVFDQLARVWSVIDRRRQVEAIAVKPA